jgi:hypothetical protein
MLRQTFRLQATDGIRGWVKGGAYMVCGELGEYKEECGILKMKCLIFLRRPKKIQGSKLSE